MEEIDEGQPAPPAEFNEESSDLSIWRETTTPAVALTLLATCGIAIDVHNSIEALGDILFTVPVTFLFWWLVCTALLWLWRVIFRSQE